MCRTFTIIYQLLHPYVWIECVNVRGVNEVQYKSNNDLDEPTNI
jgi:hypothetical protein